MIDIIKPRIPISDLARLCQQEYEKKGYRGLEVYNDAGHGVSLHSGEPPSISLNDPTIVKEDMVLAVEPNVIDWTEGGIAKLCHVEEQVVVTRGGCEISSTTPRDLVSV